VCVHAAEAGAVNSPDVLCPPDRFRAGSRGPGRKLPPHVPKSGRSLDRLHRSVGELGNLGIGLLPPKKEDPKRLTDKQKNQVIVHAVGLCLNLIIDRKLRKSVRKRG